jgi:plastocyanin
VRAPWRYLPLILALGVAVALLPALAQSAPPPTTGSFTAVDNAWNAAGGGSTVTIAPGGKVTFGYPSGVSQHNVVFDSKAPGACVQFAPTPGGGPPLPSSPSGPGWSGSCKFDAVGDYKFHCGLHGGSMSGTVKVATDATPTGAAAKKLKLKSKQRGTTVKGSIEITRDASSLDVRAFARLRELGVDKTGQRRVGRFVDLSVNAKRQSFKVKLNKTARSALRRNGTLRITVIITVTPQAGKIYTKQKIVKLRPKT